MYHVYVLKSQKDEKLYIGYTAKDVAERLEEHNSGKNKSTRPRIPFGLVYYESYRNKTDAAKREFELKHNNYQKEQLLKRIDTSLKDI